MSTSASCQAISGLMATTEGLRSGNARAPQMFLCAWQVTIFRSQENGETSDTYLLLAGNFVSP
jgi:hypothetical protein